MSRSPVDITLEPHEELAAAGARGQSARRFLSGSDSLAFWCHIANVPNAFVVAKAREVVPGLALKPQGRAA